jgi:hypothetical protein
MVVLHDVVFSSLVIPRPVAIASHWPAIGAQRRTDPDRLSSQDRQSANLVLNGERGVPKVMQERLIASSKRSR